MEKKFEIFNVYPYGNETIENVITAHDWQALKYVSHLTLNNGDMTLDRAKLLYELSQALIMNDVDIVLQRVDGTVYVCMQYEYRADNGKIKSGFKTLWEDRNEYGYVPPDKDKQFKILADCLAYIKTEIEPQKDRLTFVCGHCGKEYKALKLRTLMGKPVCEECLKVVCPICGERKEEFVITPCGSYSRVCKECYDKNPNGYELCDGCSDKPYCKGKLVDLGELYDVGEERLCEQVAQTRSDIRKCSRCGNYEELGSFIGDTCFSCSMTIHSPCDNSIGIVNDADSKVNTLFDCSRLRDLPQLDLWQDTMDSVSVHIFRNLSKVLEENKLRIVPYSQNGYTRLYLVNDNVYSFRTAPKECEYIICTDAFEVDSKDLEPQYLCLVRILDFINGKYMSSENSITNFKCNQYNCRICTINSSCPKRKLELIENDNDEDYPVLSVVFPDGWRVNPSELYDSFDSEFSEDFE